MYLAYRLLQRGERVTLLEAQSTLGGLVDGWRFGEVRWDRYYHVISQDDRTLLALLDELGLAQSVVWRATQTGLHLDGVTQPISSTLDLLRLRGLSPWDKARFAASILALASARCDRLASRNAAEWLARLAGERVFSRVWAPLLRAKFGAHAAALPASHICHIVRRLFAARSGGAKREFFGFLPDGYADFVARLTERLRTFGCDLRVATRIERIERDPSGRFRIATRATTVKADRLLVATNDRVARVLLSDLPLADPDRLCARQRLGVICTSLLLKRSPSPYYITNLTNASALTGVINYSALAGTAPFGGHHLVYLPRYDLSENLEALTDLQGAEDRLVAAFLALYPELGEDDIVQRRTAKADYIFALDTCRTEAFDVAPGVHVVSSARIGSGTLNVNETLRLADRALGSFGRLN